MESVAKNMEKKKSKYGKFDEWDIKDAARTITEAEEIKKDAEKMKHVEKCLKEKAEAAKKAVKSVQDIRDAAKEMDEEY
tara:strand:+ start:5842 stop:6078 length:237 start_codon:yes stop_codon:yes gene_type:complete